MIETTKGPSGTKESPSAEAEAEPEQSRLVPGDLYKSAARQLIAYVLSWS